MYGIKNYFNKRVICLCGFCVFLLIASLAVVGAARMGLIPEGMEQVGWDAIYPVLGLIVLIFGSGVGGKDGANT